MLASEKKLAAILLRMASEQFSNHGCNDMPREIFKEFSPEEQAELMVAYNESNNDDPDDPDCELRFTMDWLWMAIFAKKLKQEAG